MSEPKAPGKLVCVTWVDSCIPYGKWHDRSLGETYKVTTCISVGWLVRKDKNSVVLAASFGPDQIGDVSAIPTSCIQRVEFLTRPKRAAR